MVHFERLERLPSDLLPIAFPKRFDKLTEPVATSDPPVKGEETHG
jgi:hypothetical protein